MYTRTGICQRSNEGNFGGKVERNGIILLNTILQIEAMSNGIKGSVASDQCVVCAVNGIAAEVARHHAVVSHPRGRRLFHL